jgi:hypothetical protein
MIVTSAKFQSGLLQTCVDLVPHWSSRAGIDHSNTCRQQCLKLQECGTPSVSVKHNRRSVDLKPPARDPTPKPPLLRQCYSHASPLSRRTPPPPPAPGMQLEGEVDTRELEGLLTPPSLKKLLSFRSHCRLQTSLKPAKPAALGPCLCPHHQHCLLPPHLASVPGSRSITRAALPS